MIGYFFVERTGTDSYSYGMTAEDKGISFVADVQDDGSILKGIEADFVRVGDNASANDRLDGVQGIGGLAWVASPGQIKKITII